MVVFSGFHCTSVVANGKGKAQTTLVFEGGVLKTGPKLQVS